MVDGIKISYVLPNFQQWKDETGISFNITINEDTGEVKGSIPRPDKKTGLPYTSIEHRGRFETYQLTVKETTHTGKKTKYILTISGSLHKNHFGGQNYSRFTFPDLYSQINYLCLKLHLNAEKCNLKNFEYGFNLPVKYNPIEVLDNDLISYKYKPFSRMKTENQISIGYESRLSEYRIKIYDKGLQHNLPDHLMRFEKAFSKMTLPKKFKIRTLADLVKSDNLKKLQTDLLNAWNNVFLFDSSLLINVDLTEKERLFLLKCRDPKFWKKIKYPTTRQRKREKFNRLILKYGSNQNIHAEIKELLQHEFKMCMVLPSVKNETVKQSVYDFTVKIESKIIHIQKRYCKGCGKELNPQQRKGSEFCSARFVGYERAHQCRNLFFNPSNNFRNQLKRIEARGLLFDIRPYLVNSKTRSL